MIADWKKTYRFMDDMRTKWINDNMAEMEAKGRKDNKIEVHRLRRE